MSITQANKAIRVMSGERLKYTHRIFLPGQKESIEFQSKDGIKIEFLNEARSLWISYTGYQGAPIMEWIPGTIMLTEENPGMNNESP